MSAKPAQRKKTWDPSGPIMQMMENRTSVFGFKDAPMLEPHSLYTRLMTAPNALENAAFPASVFTTRLAQDQLNKKLRASVNCVAWTPDGRRLWSGHANGHISAWNGTTFGYDCHFDARSSAIRAMQWMKNGNVAVTADDNGKAHIWRANMSKLFDFRIHDEPVRALSFSPDDKKFASGGDDGLVRLYDFWSGTMEVELKGHSHDVRTIAWHPRKALIASGGKDSVVRLWDPNSSSRPEALAIHGHKSYIRQVAWNNTGGLLLTSSNDRTMKLFDIRNLSKEVCSMFCEPRDVASVAWHPHVESVFAAGHQDGTLSFWIANDPKPQAVVKAAHDQAIWSMDWHPVGHVLATGSNDCRTKFWCRARPGDPPKTFKAPRPGGYGDDDDDAPTSRAAAASVPTAAEFRHRDDDLVTGGGVWRSGGGGGLWDRDNRDSREHRDSRGFGTGANAGYAAGGPSQPPIRRSVPPDYVCRICNQPGHWIEQCPDAVRRPDGGIAPPPSHVVPQPRKQPAVATGLPPPAHYRCNRCGKGGHYMNDCKETPLPPPPDYTCRGCGGKDHWKQDCPRAQNANKTAAGPSGVESGLLPPPSAVDAREWERAYDRTRDYDHDRDFVQQPQQYQPPPQMPPVDRRFDDGFGRDRDRDREYRERERDSYRDRDRDRGRGYYDERREPDRWQGPSDPYAGYQQPIDPRSAPGYPYDARHAPPPQPPPHDPYRSSYRPSY